MAVQTDPFTFVNGTVADGTQVNSRFNLLYTLQNGNIDADNMDLTDDFDWTGDHAMDSVTTPNTTAPRSKINNSGIIEFAGANTPGWVSNLGLDLTAGVLKITDAGGTDLSGTNPGWVTIPSTTAGRLVTLEATAATHLIEDASGTSDIVGEEFGTTAGTAWGSVRPFFIYAVNSDDTASGLAFAISPDPTLSTSPATANSGFHGNPAATPSDSNFFYMTSSDVTATHDAKPCKVVGTVNATKDASDDWTFPALSNAVGIGVFDLNVLFTFPQAQMGASASTHLKANGGTAPVFTTNDYFYTLGLNGQVDLRIALDGDGGTDGAGAVSAQVATPYASNSTGSLSIAVGSGFVQYVTQEQITIPLMTPGNTHFTMDNAAVTTGQEDDDSRTVENGFFTNGARFIRISASYKAF